MTAAEGPPPGQSFDEVRRAFWDNLGDGIVCPCCDRFAKVYKRRLNATMVRALAWICGLAGPNREWVDLPEAARQHAGSYDHTKQYSTLKHWGLLEHKPNEDDPTKKESGIWRPTPLAHAFLRGCIPQPEAILTYRDIRLRFTGDVVYITDIIKGFDYQEVMRPVNMEEL